MLEETLSDAPVEKKFLPGDLNIRAEHDPLRGKKKVCQLI